MKTLNFKSHLKIALSGILLLGLWSCQRSNSSGPVQAGTPNNPTTCQNCLGLNGMNSLLTQIQSQAPVTGLSMNLSLFGQLSSYCPQPASKQVLCAQGSAVLQGSVQIANQSLCGFPPGTYQLQPIQASQIGYGVISGGSYRITAGNGQSLTLQVWQGILYNPTGLDATSNTNRLGLSAAVYYGNNPCGGIDTY